MRGRRNSTPPAPPYQQSPVTRVLALEGIFPAVPLSTPRLASGFRRYPMGGLGTIQSAGAAGGFPFTSLAARPCGHDERLDRHIRGLGRRCPLKTLGEP